MSDEPGLTLRTALEREHQQIDAGLEGFRADPTAADGLTAAFTALRRHIYLEEEHLFPPLRAQGLMAPVLVMLREHGELWAALDEIERLHGGGSPAHELQQLVEHLLELLDRHNAKEEPIVYGAAERTLDDSTAAELNDLVRTSTLPPGWLCERARTV